MEKAKNELSKEKRDSVEDFLREQGCVGGLLFNPDSVHCVFSNSLVENPEVLENAIAGTAGALQQLVRYSQNPRRSFGFLVKAAQEIFEEYFPEEAKKAQAEMSIFSALRKPIS